jgi:hypothetical protein
MNTTMSLQRGTGSPTAAGVIECVGGRDPEAEGKLVAAIAKSGFASIWSLRSPPDEPDEHLLACRRWLVALDRPTGRMRISDAATSAQL